MTTRVPFRTDSRSGLIGLLQGYIDDAGLGFQLYRARPKSIYPPTGFVDRITEDLAEYTLTTRTRTTSVELVVIHGLFDSGDAADQADAFCDGFLDWVADRPHGFGANSLVAVTHYADIPNYTPDWMETQTAYYATEITLEGSINT